MIDGTHGLESQLGIASGCVPAGICLHNDDGQSVGDDIVHVTRYAGPFSAGRQGRAFFCLQRQGVVASPGLVESILSSPRPVGRNDGYEQQKPLDQKIR
ncbi:hypothetical protein [Bifidobacterium apicola]|uniref:hypothetical protein n=1 Tax=Bifidobacterium apicola TaxID=3230739 RepID=UPI0036F1F66B